MQPEGTSSDDLRVRLEWPRGDRGDPLAPSQRSVSSVGATGGDASAARAVANLDARVEALADRMSEIQDQTARALGEVLAHLERLAEATATNTDIVADVADQRDELSRRLDERFDKLEAARSGAAPDDDAAGERREMQRSLQQVHDLVEAVADTLDAPAEGGDQPPVEQQLAPRFEELARHFDERLAATIVPNAAAQLRPHLEQIATDQRRLSDLVEAQVRPHLERLAAEQARRHDELTRRIDSGFAAAEQPPVDVQLQPHLQQLSADQRRLSDLVEAVADSLDTPADGGDQPDVEGQLRRHHDELTRHLDERLAADRPAPVDHRAALADLTQRTAVLEDLVNELAETDGTVSETLTALRQEVAQLRRGLAPMDEPTVTALAAAVAKRIEEGPVT